MSRQGAELLGSSHFCRRNTSRCFYMDISLQGTIRRCPHSVYWPAGHKIAFACGFCNPDHFNASGTGRVPVFMRDKHRDPEVPFANKNRPPCTSRCPKCESTVHYESEAAGGPWECADCGTKFRGRAE
jgi:hypothetical protein